MTGQFAFGSIGLSLETTGEKPFSRSFCDLAVSEMDFWLSRFVLEVRKANGILIPPNSLYELVCGLQRYLREHGCADIKLFENPSLCGFRSTLDGEMKRLNATSNYINKKQANTRARKPTVFGS